MHDGVRVGWFIPTAGDTTRLAEDPTEIPPGLEHFVEVARTAEEAGFAYALVPVQTACWDAYVTCSFVAARTERLKLLLAARPGFVAPTVMAKMLATFDQLSGGRVMVNLIAGGGAAEMEADGLFLDHDDRYALMDEVVEVMKRVWTTRAPVDFEGRFVRVRGARVLPSPRQSPYPPFFLGGGSPAAQRVSVRHADVHLFWGDHPDHVAEQAADLRRRAQQAEARGERDPGRPLGFGMRLQVIVRETEAEAWEAAHRLVAGERASTRQRVRALWEQSSIQARQQQLADAEDEGLLVEGHPHLWAGIGRVRPGAGVAVVGDPDQVAATLGEFVDAGCRDFCLSGYPHHREARRVGELVLPRLGPLLS
ncbi:MAG: LLM class flavin-dependent oxidoreductase [Acidimicrobiia bacterium]|nr:LLM class flavin-dependent oxidoreductase [Acidimicrobiia bacterium]